MFRKTRIALYVAMLMLFVAGPLAATTPETALTVEPPTLIACEAAESDAHDLTVGMVVMCGDLDEDEVYNDIAAQCLELGGYLEDYELSCTYLGGGMWHYRASATCMDIN